VLEVLKNTSKDSITVGETLWLETASNEAECGVNLTPGKSYILYPTRKDGPLGLYEKDGCIASGLSTGLCSPRIGPDPTAQKVAEVKAQCGQ
jgi:hypothetical protein